MPPNPATHADPPSALFAHRHRSQTRVQLSLSDLPAGNGSASTRNRDDAPITIPGKPDNIYAFTGRFDVVRPSHEHLVTGGRNDGASADPFAALMGPPLDALGGADARSLGLRWARVADATAAGAPADQRGTDHPAGTAREAALAIAIVSALALAGLVLGTHPLIREALVGSVLAIWPAWVLALAVFGVAMVRGAAP